MKPTKFVFTELRTEDAARARAFYADLLGWEYQDVPGAANAYALVRSGGEVFGAIASGAPESGAQWLGYVGVADVNAMTAKAKALGAKLEIECQRFGDFGTLTVLLDPTGARLGLWQEAPKPDRTSSFKADANPSVELVRNEWAVVHRHEGLIELRWLPSTSSMSDGGFMATLCLFVWEAEKARPTALLIDATEFRHKFGEGVMEWRDRHIIPRYGAAGVRRFAFLMPPAFPGAGKEAVEGPAVFPTKWFVDRKEAIAWLLQ